MNRLHLLLLLSLFTLFSFAPATVSAAPAAENHPRTSLLWNFGWKFHAGDIADGASMTRLNKNLRWYTSKLVNEEKARISSANAIWYHNGGSLKLNDEFLAIFAVHIIIVKRSICKAICIVYPYLHRCRLQRI